MKNLKTYEYYYDDKNKSYSDDEFYELANSAFKDNKYYYIHDKLEEVIPELTQIKDRLREMHDDMETYGPYDDDIEDIIDSLNKVLKKWENRPINKAAKKYNL